MRAKKLYGILIYVPQECSITIFAALRVHHFIVVEVIIGMIEVEPKAI